MFRCLISCVRMFWDLPNLHISSVNLHGKHIAAHVLFKLSLSVCVWNHVCFIFNITLLAETSSRGTLGGVLNGWMNIEELWRYLWFGSRGYLAEVASDSKRGLALNFQPSDLNLLSNLSRLIFPQRYKLLHENNTSAHRRQFIRGVEECICMRTNCTSA